MTSESGPLMEEHVLRRSLRLDADEVPPRLDPALIAAAATTSSPSGSGLGLAVVVAFAGGWLWSEIFRGLLTGFVAATGVDVLASAIDLIITAAVRLAPIAEIATHPAVPIAIFAAAVVAVLTERGRAHAASS